MEVVTHLVKCDQTKAFVALEYGFRQVFEQGDYVVERKQLCRKMGGIGLE